MSLQAWVGVGSLDETKQQRGMSHLLEHLLFKGTEKRGVGEIAKTVEHCGGNINAYTSFDRTVYYLSLTSDFAEVGIDLLSDAVLHSALDADEIEKEKEVVVEEIRRGLDNPGNLVGQKMFSHAFKGCEAARPIIGTEEGVKGFSRQEIYDFYQHWYQPSNMTVICVGNFKEEECLGWVKKYFGSKENSTTIERRPINREFATGKVDILKGDYQQPRLELFFEAPGLYHEDSVALDLAAFALGSGDSSRLNRRLRDKDQLVAAIGASLYAPSFAGLLTLSCYPTVDSSYKTVEACCEELSKLIYSNPVSDCELEKARSYLKTDYLYQEETIEGQAKALGSAMMTKYKEHYDDVYLAQVNRTTSADINKALRRWITPESLSITGMVPEGMEIDEAQLWSAVKKGFALSKSQAVKPNQGQSQLVPPQVIKLKDGVTLVYRQSPEAKFFNLVAVTEGGQRAESRESAGIFNAMSDVLATATKTRNYDQYLELMDKKGCDLISFSGKDSLGFQLSCIPEHSQEMGELFFESILEPVFPSQQWQTAKFGIEQRISTQDDSSAGVCMRNLQEGIYANHPYGFPIYGYKDSVATFDEDLLLKKYLKYRDDGPWIIGCTTSQSLDEVKGFIEKHIADWNPKPKVRSLTIPSRSESTNRVFESVDKNREQIHVAMGFSALQWSDPGRAALDVIGSILGGQGGRLFLNLRDQQSLAYSVAPIISFGFDPGFFACYVASAPQKKDQVFTALDEQLKRLLETEPDDVELEGAKNQIIGQHLSGNQRSSSQAMTMALMQLYGVGADDFLKYPDSIRQVTTLRPVAERIINMEDVVKVIVG